MLHHLEGDGFAEKFICSDEATFHLRGKVNRHHVRMWRSENPYSTVEHIGNFPKMNVVCAISIRKVYWPLFFAETNHWHVLYCCDAGLVVVGWRWQWWHHLPARWGSATLPPTRSRLPQSAFAPTLGRTHDRGRPGASSLATKIAWPNSMRYVQGSAAYRLYHRIYLSSEDESSLPFQKSIVTSCSGYGRKWIFGLTSAVSQKADT